MYLVFDTETAGLPTHRKNRAANVDAWPRVVQLAWGLYDKGGKRLHERDFLIKPSGFTIPDDATAIHGITTERALHEGIALEDALKEFSGSVRRAAELIAHNITFDESVVQAEYARTGLALPFADRTRTCTMRSTVKYCALPGKRGLKYPSLAELHQKLFETDFSGAHDAKNDVAACAKCFFELRKREIL